VTAAGTQTYVFESTNAAFWAEDMAREKGIPVELVPAPAEAEAKCDLAMVTLVDHAVSLEEALEREGVPFRAWPA
jgi:hypothetical protein